MSNPASRCASASLHGSGPNTLRLPSSIQTSPSIPSSQLPSATRASSTRLNRTERAADNSIDRCSRPMRAPRAPWANIASALPTLPPPWPKRCPPNALGTPRAATWASRASIASRSPITSRSTSTKRLPANAPRDSLRRCRAWASTRMPSRSSEARSGASRPGNCTLKRCTVTAWRSFCPAQPTACSGTPAQRASSRATKPVFMLRFSMLSSRCSPSPLASKASSSSTRKSSATVRIRADSTGGPNAPAGAPAPRAASRPSRPSPP